MSIEQPQPQPDFPRPADPIDKPPPPDAMPDPLPDILPPPTQPPDMSPPMVPDRPNYI